MSEHTARRFMAVARQFGDKTSTVRDLDPTALYELASPKTPIDIREEIELVKMATRIRDRAIRRAGELLKQIEPAKPGPKPEIGTGAHTELGRQAAGEQAGMSKHQQVQAVRVANVPEEDFNRQVESEPAADRAIPGRLHRQNSA